MIFRQLFDSVSGTYTYLLASRRGGEALIIDPVLEKVDRYLQLIRELDLKLVKAVDTHLHADHITGLGALRDRTHCITVMGEQTKADVVSMRLAEGDKLTDRGRVARRALHARPHRRFLQLPDGRPGVHRRHAADPRHRPHRFPERRPARSNTNSIFNKLLKLPDEHAGVSGARLQGRHGLDHRRGEGVQSAPAGEVGRRIRRADEQPQSAQSEDDGRGGAGQHEGRAGAGGDRAARLGGEREDALALVGKPDVAFIDLRERSEREQHGVIPGSLHAPYPSSPPTSRPAACCTSLRGATSKRLLFYCAFGERSAMAVQAAQDARLTSACHLQGGIDAWKKAGGPLER